MKHTCWLFFLLISLPVFPQTFKIDSLRASIVSYQNDTIKVQTFLKLAAGYKRISLDSTFYFGEQAYQLSLKQAYKKGEAEGILWMGISEWRRGNLLQGLEYCQKALALSSTENLKEIEAEALINIGLIHNYHGNYPVALEFYQKGLVIGESLQSNTLIASALINIGGIHYNLKDFDLALEYWKKTFLLQQQLGDKASAASCLNNIGLAYADKGDYEMALKCYFQAMDMYQTACSHIYPLENIGHIYLKMNQLDSADFYLKQALSGAEKCNNPILEIGALTGLADTYKLLNQPNMALLYLEKAMKIGTKAGLNRETGLAAKSLSELYESIGNTQAAFRAFKQFHAIQDSLYNNEKAKNIGKLEAQYEYELAKRIENVEKEKLIAREKWIKNTFIGGFFIMLVVAFLIYRNFQRKKISNLRLQVLNNEINEQQKELLAQAEELQQLNDSLHNLNHDLEHKVAERTQELITKNTELEDKNTQLADYAFINAHKLRAPVATILGLAALFDNKEVNNQERKEIVDKIKTSALELNEIVREIRETLENGRKS